MMMEAISTSVKIYIPENCRLHIRRCEILKFTRHLSRDFTLIENVDFSMITERVFRISGSSLPEYNIIYPNPLWALVRERVYLIIIMTA